MEQISSDRQRQLLDDISRLAAECVAAERVMQDEQAARQAELVRRFQQRREELAAIFEKEVAGLRGQYKRLRENSIYRFDSDSFAVVQEKEQFTAAAAAEQEKLQERAKRVFQTARQDALDAYEANKDKPRKEFENFRVGAEASREELRKLLRQAAVILKRRRCEMPTEFPDADPLGEQPPMERLKAEFTVAARALRILERRPAAKFLEDGWPFLIFLFLSLGGVYPAGVSLGWPIGVATTLVGAAVISQIVKFSVQPFARKQTRAALPPFLQAVGNGEACIDAAIAAADLAAKKKHEAMVERRDTTIREAEAAWVKRKVELTAEYQARVEKANAEFALRRQQIKDRHEREIAEIEAKYPAAITAREQQFTADSQILNDDRKRQLEAFRDEFERRWSQLESRWRGGVADFAATIAEMQAFCDRRFPPWETIDPNTWQPTKDDLPMLRFGELLVDLKNVTGGLPTSERLALDRTEFNLPTVLTYPDFPSLLYQADGTGRDVAIRSLQNVMLRLLTSLPPGKVRFTIIDPTGLGQNFSAFMHLADFDERLVNSRIWTETIHINKRLADLTEHMENVIQKYLRNEFASIQEYNLDAGEVAEPFQILVIANFPANFSEEAARRLVSIAISGARCGVYTLISCDTKLKLPRNLELGDLTKQAVVLDWKGERFGRQTAGLEQLPLALEMPPDEARVTGLIRTVGELAKDANRVEVPFDSVAPAAADWWTGDSRSEIAVPLGRAGATKLQALRLGRGTSQHVLISGKTGSGKSTLLHALITNLAAHYSPNEVQFYLIDFKKGVEFKAYATCRLPHARVIAIESEREFGMSVLERLDGELKRRGDLFRGQGVQDLAGYRDANPDAVMPRTLLIIDEFQEFFVKDDKIAADAALLLDRLVRQGRAFGIHVLLGSQTLAGAYSLARATLGQMAVRIALQCSEADAHLILSDDNTAARLLNRPGEAIYNDANGLFEGNHPFQVVWLPDHQREQYLRRANELAATRSLRLPPPIVFEGNAPADPAENPLLAAALGTPPTAASLRAPRAWLGAAVAIKDPAVAVFHRQSGANLLVVGQHDEMALGVLANAVIGLAAECWRGGKGDGIDGKNGNHDVIHNSHSSHQSHEFPPAFTILDGERAESPRSGFWRQLADRLPIAARVSLPKEAAAAISELAAEVERRMAAADDHAPPIFLLIYNLARFRDLRKSEDFGFSFEKEAKAGADQQLATILREGPTHGVHALIWCDNFTNIGRWLDRQSMSDLAYRVLFQMSATDSANLMDSPEASRLGVHRAVFYNEEQGEFEKFRPYGVPEADWLNVVRERLTERSFRE